MAENDTANEKQFAIQKIYTKDISFEAPNAPRIFTQKWEPSLDLNLGTHIDVLEANVYDVTLTLTVVVKLGDTIAYLTEVKQSGIFTMSGFSEPELAPMLGIFCPNVLFPYAREVVSDLVSKGGFPQLLLAPINFEALYAQQLQQAQAQQTDGEAASPTIN
jgi:preprotein translocase subunit SecB